MIDKKTSNLNLLVNPKMGYKCEFCHKSFYAKHSLEKHIHENVRPFNRDTCGKIFKSNSNFKEHVTQVNHNIKNWKLTGHFVAVHQKRNHMFVINVSL